MKRYVVMCFTLCLFAGAFAQGEGKPPTYTDTLELLCQRWVSVTMSVGEKGAEIREDQAIYHTFKPDGSYTDSSALFGVSRGTWVYEQKTRRLYFEGKVDDVKSTIVKLTADELVIEIAYPAATMTLVYKRLD